MGACAQSAEPERYGTGWTLFDDNIAAGRSSPQRKLIVSHWSTDSIKAAQPLIRTSEPVPPGITEPHVQSSERTHRNGGENRIVSIKGLKWRACFSRNP